MRDENTFANISIHALRKESDDLLEIAWKAVNISIHALRKESGSFRHPKNQQNIFQSTLSVRRATPVGETINDE